MSLGFSMQFEIFLTERTSLIHSMDRDVIHTDLKWLVFFFRRPKNA